MSAVTSIPRGNENLDIRVERITPAKAHEYLGYNTHNRNLRSRVTNAYAADMRNGDWLWNGESIKFGVDGALLDGQHRLAGVIVADVPVRMLVIRGLPNITQETMDGGAKRKFADVLKLRGEANYTTLATTIRAVAEWSDGIRGRTSAKAYTNAQMFAVLNEYPWLRDGTVVISKATRNAGLPATVGGLMWWLAMCIDTQDADAFFDRLCSDENHQSGEPVHELRKAIGNASNVRGERSARYLLAITIKAWNKYRDGESVALLSYRPGGAKPERFPEPR